MASYILLIQHSLEDPATLPRLWALLILCLFGVPLLACLLARAEEWAHVITAAEVKPETWREITPITANTTNEKVGQEDSTMKRHKIT
jgi:hypothetical protein